MRLGGQNTFFVSHRGLVMLKFSLVSNLWKCLLNSRLWDGGGFKVATT